MKRTFIMVICLAWVLVGCSNTKTNIEKNENISEVASTPLANPANTQNTLQTVTVTKEHAEATVPKAIQSPTPVPTTTPKPNQSTTGQTKGVDFMPIVGNSSLNNASNSSVVVKQGDWIYYYDYKQNGIAKIKYDGTGKQLLTTGQAYYLNVSGDYIYFVNMGTKKVYRVKTDGSGLSAINDLIYFSGEPILGFTIYNSKIYYIVNRFMYTANLDGSNCKRLDGIIGLVSDFIIRNNQIYYVSSTDGAKIYRINLDGSMRTRLTNTPAYHINISGNWMYYTNEKDNNRIYRTSISNDLYKLENSESAFVDTYSIRNQVTEKISNDPALSVNVNGNYIYYYNLNDKGSLYCITTSGSDRRKFNDRPSANINIIGNWIFYAGNATMYRMMTDGTNDQQMR